MSQDLRKLSRKRSRRQTSETDVCEIPKKKIVLGSTEFADEVIPANQPKEQHIAETSQIEILTVDTEKKEINVLAHSQSTKEDTSVESTNSTIKRKHTSTTDKTSESHETPNKKRILPIDQDLKCKDIPVNKDKHDKEEEATTVECTATTSQKSMITDSKSNKAPRKRNLFAKFSQGKLLGTGSYGKVYAGMRIEDRLPENGSEKSLPAEICLQQNLDHPHIIKLIDYYHFDKKYVLVFERPRFCMDLFDYLENFEDSRCNERDGKMIFREVLDAVMYLEEKGIVHNDIKTENILMDLSHGNRKAKLIDFGLARRLTDHPIKKHIGTREFSPPEFHITKQFYSREATVWSLGCLLFDMLTGNPPFKGSKQAANLPLEMPDHFSDDLKDILLRMLEKRPSERITLGDIKHHRWLNTSSFCNMF